ncbi:MAG: hypothetical protein JXE07_02810 [Candidatus Aminicenantes bacterium]|nr:hypothetical protein [Candidatus Aminicenantes bacterium]
MKTLRRNRLNRGFVGVTAPFGAEARGALRDQAFLQFVSRIKRETEESDKIGRSGADAIVIILPRRLTSEIIQAADKALLEDKNQECHGPMLGRGPSNLRQERNHV